MSIQHVSRVLDARDDRLTGCRKLVLVTLANRTDTQGRCWPSQELLAGECGVSVRALSDHLKALEADGFVKRTTKHLGRGNGSRTVYALNLDALKNAPAEIADAKLADAELAPAKSVESTGSRPRVTNRQEPTIPTEANASVVSAKPANTPRSDAARGTRLSPDWTLPDDWLAEARRIAFKAKMPLTDEEIQNEADKFRDYWNAAPGAKGRKCDWLATWRTWVRNGLERRAARRNAPGGYAAGPVNQHGRGSIAAAAIRREFDRQNQPDLSQRSGGDDLVARAGDWGRSEPQLIG